MRYQLVLQFGASSLEDFDILVALEELLIAKMAAHNDTLVDGHDSGMGEFNIFIHTNEPRTTFAEVKHNIEETSPGVPFSAAYRSLSGEEYVVLWPPTLEEFRVV